MKDAFAVDAEARTRLSREIASVRVALFRASEADDAAGALAALKRAYALLDRFPEGQMLCTGNHETNAAFGVVAPPKARAIRSRFSGMCSVCDERYSAGDIIWWSHESRFAVCTRCGGVPSI